ncbi:MAG: hypothetical protein FWB77_01590 [Treponema sp.]|nr:hypothetical protein [Treponema sp.]
MAKSSARAKTILKTLKITFLAFTIASCSVSPSAYEKIDSAVEETNFESAVNIIRRGQEKKRAVYSQRNSILLFLDKGFLEHYAGNYAASSADLQTAERLIQEAYTKSISEGFLSYIINDNTKEYPGEDFEDIYLNIFNALNYYHRGDLEGALVEIRKLSESSGKLDLLARKYEYTDPKTGAGLNEMARRETGVRQMPQIKTAKFSNSALARFLSALFYLGEGNIDAGRIELEQVYRAYSANTNIYRGQVPRAVEEIQNIPDGKGRLNIISFTGLSPVKEEQIILHHLPFHHPVLQIAAFKLPALVQRPSRITMVEVVVNQQERFYLELLEDIGAVIIETYNAHYSNMLLKTYIRTIIKYSVADVIAMEASRQQDSLAGLMAAIAARTAMDVSENADTRMSRYLPDKAYIGGINLDPGTYSVIINYYSGNRIISNAVYNDVIVRQNGLNLIQSVKLR